MSLDSSDSKSIIAYYESLHPVLKQQLASLESRFRTDTDILPVAESLYAKQDKKNRKHPKIRMICQRIAMLEVISPDYFFDRKWFPHVCCYDNRGHTVTFDQQMAIGKYVFVLSGKLDSMPVVAKWYQSRRRDTLFEIDIYCKLRKLGLPMFWFSSTYEFWGSPILIMEKLEPLTRNDNEFEVGIAVLEQLMTVHQVGIHNDIKPGNVMKRIKNGTPEYFIIDYGGIATERLGFGYRRWIWSPKWTSQRPHVSNQITTQKHDFIELGYTMKTMQNWTTGDTRIREEFSGKLEKYMARVARIDKRNVVKQDYLDLINILKE